MTGSVKEVTPLKFEITGKSGKVYKLRELTMLDVADGEDLIGRPFTKWFDGLSMKTTGQILWILVRQPTGQDGAWSPTLTELLGDVTVATWNNIKQEDLVPFLGRGSATSPDS